jgi:hypothetical protein
MVAREGSTVFLLSGNNHYLAQAIISDTNLTTAMLQSNGKAREQ